MLLQPLRVVAAVVAFLAACAAALAADPAVSERRDLAYLPGTPAARLDVYRPAGATGPLPAVIWVHGGAFVTGSKEEVAPYLKRIAAAGYAVVGLDYTLAPAARYPRPVEEVNAALGFVSANAADLGIDGDRLFIAGDSAGAQVAGQVANLVADPAYAKAMGIVPALDRTALRGVILFCGILDPETSRTDGPFGDFMKAISMAYFGTPDLLAYPRLREFSVVRNVSAGLPPLFISVGNADPLAPHSERMAEVAAALGVSVTTVFFAADAKPALEHEYQFDLSTQPARIAFARMIAFLAKNAR